MTDKQATDTAVDNLYTCSPKYLTGYLQAWVRWRLWLLALIDMMFGITTADIHKTSYESA